MMFDFRVVIPTYNAGAHAIAQIEALRRQQGLQLEQVLVIDSSSTDGTAQRFKEYGCRVHVIPQEDFDHGGTRRWAVQEADAPIVVFLTQDAIPDDDDALSRLVHAFADPAVGLAYGRQLPRPQASAIERHARLFNYPAQSATRRLEDRRVLGVKTVFCSDSFAAYRMQALDQVGSFPEHVFFAEDQIVAGRMALHGWAIAYVGDAAVVHSHAYSALDDFRRYFDVGVFHASSPWLLEAFGAAEGEGLRFVKSEVAYLLHHQPAAIPLAALRTLFKYGGYRLGRLHRRLPLRLKAHLSMAGYYWRREMARGRGGRAHAP
jgi:rhamnosyltransferase